MKRLLLALLFVATAHAEFTPGKGDTPANPISACVLEWDYSAADEARIDGFQFEINGVKGAKFARKLRQADCRRLKIKTGLTGVRLYAYKGAESSAPSNQLDFYFLKTAVSDDDPAPSSLPIPAIHFRSSHSI